MSLEEELAQSMTGAIADLDKAIGNLRPGATGIDALHIVISEALIPTLGRQRDAILRLAREVDELRAGQGED